MTPPQMPKTRATLLTLEETAKAAEGIKLLATSKGFNRYTDLHMALVGAGYPASYATFTRLLSVSRQAQESELVTIARFFGVQARDLTGSENPMKDPAPPRLVEFDIPAPAATPEGPRPLPLPRSRRDTPKQGAEALLLADAITALADGITELTSAIREFRGAGQEPAPALAEVS